MANDDNEDHPAPRRTRKRPSPVSALRLASSPSARTAYMVVGVLGLVALAAAIAGPKRVRRDVLNPLRDAIEPHAEKAWSEIRPLRQQVSALLERASVPERQKLVQELQSWIGHFRAE